MGSSLGSISMIPFVSDADKGQDFKIGSFISNDHDDSSRNVAIGSSLNLSNKNDFCFWS